MYPLSYLYYTTNCEKVNDRNLEIYYENHAASAKCGCRHRSKKDERSGLSI